MTIRSQYFIFSIFMIALLSCTACEKEDGAKIEVEKTHLIIDTDMAIDDAMALLYLMQYPDLVIDGIIVSGAGFAHLDPGLEHARGLTALAGKPDIPIIPGDTTAMMSHHNAQIPSAWRLDADTLLGMALPQNDRLPVSQKAENFLIETLSHSDAPVRLLALGPLTSIGKALEKAPGLVEKIESIYIMGGAVHTPGNIQAGGISQNTVAEWNIYLDPHAADIVFRSGAKICLIALDATEKAPVTMEFYHTFADDHSTPAADFVYQMMSKITDRFDDWYYFWDPLAAAVATDRSIITTRNLPLQVITAAGNETGWTKIDPSNGQEIEVGQDTDLPAFEALFLDILNGRR